MPLNSRTGRGSVTLEDGRWPAGGSVIPEDGKKPPSSRTGGGCVRPPLPSLHTLLSDNNALHSTTLHYTALHCTALHYTYVYFTPL